ncbi:ABC transporter ATP-binding protein [Neobacillus dielmonensis]|uniref:ABC transporter ATP-binding protein n=1 Tax=Neobacillus dielmonensis TaxID=1347369 RepID=UPI0029E7FE0D|nr:ABC transporter ATP-binding protein [Neobacillus dielmonensis]
MEVTALSKSFDTVNAVNNLSFSLKEGRCTALLGPNGAGKTTTLEMLAGLLVPTKGTILFMGSNQADYREHIGYLPQQPVFFSWMNAVEYLVFMGELSGMAKATAASRADELLELVGMADAKKRRIGGYSGGMKQRLGIAQAMIHEPKLLILDEPVSALDPVGRRDMLEMMKRLKGHMTILFSTHILHDAEEVCDDVMMIHKGELAVAGSLPELRRNYLENIIIISAEESLDTWARTLERWTVITEVRVRNNTLELFVSDLDKARSQLLAEITEKKIPISSFTVGSTTLEDLFMKVVGK